MVDDLYDIIDKNNIEATRVPISDKGSSSSVSKIW